MFWNRHNIINVFPQYNLIVAGHTGGDCDLIALHFHHPKLMKEMDDCIIVTPFVKPTQIVNNPDEDQDIYVVEIKNQWSDSRGGCYTKNELIEQMYSTIKLKLRQMGYHIVNHYDEVS